MTILRRRRSAFNMRVTSAVARNERALRERGPCRRRVVQRRPAIKSPRDSSTSDHARVHACTRFRGKSSDATVKDLWRGPRRRARRRIGRVISRLMEMPRSMKRWITFPGTRCLDACTYVRIIHVQGLVVCRKSRRIWRASVFVGTATRLQTRRYVYKVLW